MENMQSMGSISRQIFDHSVGDHIWHNIDDPNVPFADIYLLECFINGAEKFLHFQRPYKNAKIISLIHSSSKCLPAICSDKVITVSNASNKMIKQAGFENTTIYASVNMEIFNKNIDYNNLNFGRITRYSRGKVHPKWDGIAIDILEKYKDSNCYMISNNYPEIKHDRFNIIRDVKINDDKMKAEHLSKLSLFVAMHNTFFETFNLCLLEAMSIGLPIILYSETKQSAMIEVLGDAGIICNTIDDFKYTIESFLINPNLKKEYGLKAKKRAEYFTVDKMIDHYNAVFLEVINGK
jgi:glycosyltransferase involved in cell wall biosynthesis